MLVKPFRALVACLVIVVSLAAAQSNHGAGASTRYRTSTVRVKKGLTLSRILDRRGPNRIRVLKVDPATSLTIDVALANNQLPGRQRTSTMARRHDAIAATNGTYGLPWGRPIGLFSEDGKLHTSPLMGNRAFSISRDESLTHVGSPKLQMSARVLDTDSTWPIDTWNEEGRPGLRQIAALTPSGTGYLKPPRWACSARLYPIGPRTWTKRRNGLTTDYVVDAVRCAERRMPPAGGTVISALWRGVADKNIRALQRKQVIRLRWSLRWTGVMDMMAGNPTLLEDGTVTATDCPASFCNRHPRTGVGVTPEGKLLLVTVDGRQRRSVGMTPRQFAKLFRRLGARWALNLDGGGSTAMFVKGDLVNRPSDPGGERAVSSALLVLPGPDRREGEPSLYSDSTPPQGGLISVAPRRLIATNDGFDPAAIDPASTGGMLEALSSGRLTGDPQPLPRSLERVVHRFRVSERRL
jgi:exopolysaccharide biosynthesis protein